MLSLKKNGFLVLCLSIFLFLGMFAGYKIALAAGLPTNIQGLIDNHSNFNSTTGFTPAQLSASNSMGNYILADQANLETLSHGVSMASMGIPGEWYGLSSTQVQSLKTFIADREAKIEQARTELANTNGFDDPAVQAKGDALIADMQKSLATDVGAWYFTYANDPGRPNGPQNLLTETDGDFRQTQANVDAYNAKVAAENGDTHAANLLASHAAARQAAADLNKNNAKAKPIVCYDSSKNSVMGLIPTGGSFDPVGCAALASWVMLKVAAWVLTLVAMVFNVTLDYTLNFKDFIARGASDGKDIVTIGWTAFRDVINLFFIFVLVYIGIGTIINSGTYNAKNLLVKVLLGAVLLNFSLFFTQALIDVSNIFALQFYNAITASSANLLKTNAGNGTDPAGDTSIADSGISAGIIRSLGLDQIFTLGERTAAGETKQTEGIDPSTGLSAGQLLIYSLGGSVFILVTAFVLGMAAIMFLVRAITLIFLMILSPVAFAGKLLPSTEGYVKEWWDKLFANLILAPVYMANMYVVLSIVFRQGASNSGAGLTNQGFLSVFSPGADAANIAFTFAVLIGLMIGCQLIASKIGDSGSKAVMAFGKKWTRAAGSFVGGTARTTVSYAGAGVAGAGMIGARGAGRAGLAGTRFFADKLGTNLAQKGPVGQFLGSRMLQLRDTAKATKIGGVSFDDTVKKKNLAVSKRAQLIEDAHAGAYDGDDDEKKKEAKEKGRAAADAYLGKKGTWTGAFTRTGVAAVKDARKARGKLAKTKGKSLKEAQEDYEKLYTAEERNTVDTNWTKVNERLKRVQEDIKTAADKDIKSLTEEGKIAHKAEQDRLIALAGNYRTERADIMKILEMKKKVERAQKELTGEKFFDDDKK